MKIKYWQRITMGIIISLLFSNVCFAEENITSEESEDVKIIKEMSDKKLLELTAEELYKIDDNFDVIKEITEIDSTKYIPVLMYHHFVEEDVEAGNGTTINIEQFEEHLKAFQELGYTTIFFDDLYALIMDESLEDGFDEKYICITIDDGYRSNYELAYPLLKKYNAKASISVITSRIHTGYIKSPEVPKLSWENLNEMQESGLVEFYNHSTNHVQETKINVSDFVKAVKDAENELDKKLNSRGAKVFTYPYGDHNLLTTTRLRQMGYDLQIITDYGVVTKGTWINTIPRINIESGMSSEMLMEKIEAAAQIAFSDENNDILKTVREKQPN